MIERVMLSDKSRASELPEELQIETGDAKTSKSRTPGWKFFDAMVYGVMQYGINIGLSLIMFWDNEYHGKPVHLEKQKEQISQMEPGLKKAWQKTLYGYRSGFNKINEVTDRYLSEPLANFATKLMPSKSLIDAGPIKTPTRDDEGFKSGLRGLINGLMVLVWGGRILMLPNKWLEDNKPKLVRFFDKMNDKIRGVFVKEPSAEELAEREQIYKKLDTKLATESMGDLIIARLTGEAMVAGAVFVPLFFDRERKGFTRIGDAAMGGMRKLEGATGDVGRWSFLHPQPEGTFDPNYPPRANKLQGLAYATSLEGVSTGIAATALYLKLKAKELFGQEEEAQQKANEKAAGKNAKVLNTPDEKPIDKETLQNEYKTVREFKKKSESKEWANENTKKRKPDAPAADHRTKRKQDKATAEEAEMAIA